MLHFFTDLDAVRIANQSLSIFQQQHLISLLKYCHLLGFLRNDYFPELCFSLQSTAACCMLLMLCSFHAHIVPFWKAYAVYSSCTETGRFGSWLRATGVSLQMPRKQGRRLCSKPVASFINIELVGRMKGKAFTSAPLVWPGDQPALQVNIITCLSFL